MAKRKRRGREPRMAVTPDVAAAVRVIQATDPERAVALDRFLHKVAARHVARKLSEIGRLA